MLGLPRCRLWLHWVKSLRPRGPSGVVIPCSPFSAPWRPSLLPGTCPSFAPSQRPLIAPSLHPGGLLSLLLLLCRILPRTPLALGVQCFHSSSLSMVCTCIRMPARTPARSLAFCRICQAQESHGAMHGATPELQVIYHMPVPACSSSRTTPEQCRIRCPIRLACPILLPRCSARAPCMEGQSPLVLDMPHS